MKRTTGKIFLRFFILTTIFLLLVTAHSKTYAAVITVTSTADTGAGTLREAITTLASSGDIIHFSGSMTITLATPIVIKVSGLTIDATTVSGWSPSANQVMLSGAGTSTGAFSTNGSMYLCDNLTIKGLIFNGFTGSTIILMDAANFTVKNCWFGLLANGTSPSAHTGTNIVVSKTSSYGTIGSSIPSERNIFNITSASAGACIFFSATGTSVYPSQLIYVLGNYFGTDYSGTTVLGMGPSSAFRTSGSNGSGFNIGGPGANDGNLIEGYSSGHAFQGSSPVLSDITIQGNKMGTLSGTVSTSSAILLCPDNESMFILNNTIQRSGTYAIDMSPSTYTDQVEVHKNQMSNNASGGINNSIGAPGISSATPSKIMGTSASANGVVDIYTWDGLGAVQGSTWLASVTADASGNWFYYGTFTVGQKLTVTSTPVVSSPTPPTSKFSTPFNVTTCPSSVSAGADLTTCSTSPSLGITGNGVSITGSPTWSIVSGGSGTLTSSNTYAPTYNLSAGEQANTGAAITVVLQVSAATSTCAATISDQMILTINPKPVVNAGGNITVCANNANVALAGSVTNAGGGSWTGGAGTYSPNATTVNATYTPTATEKSAGSVTLTLTSTGNGTCTAIASSKTITITPAPTANAGTSQTMCASGSINLNGSVTVATGGQWTTTGSIGSLSSTTSLTPLYIPSTADKAAGTVTLTLTTTGNGTCTPVTSQMTITINPVPIVNAGLDQTACTPSANITLAGSVTNATGGQWTTTGGGSFSPNATTLNATYIPTTAERNATSSQTITFTLTSTGNGTCTAITDQMVLTINPSPTANAGLAQTVCANGGSVSVNGTVTSASGGTWTSSGNGSFANPNLLNASYTLGSVDIANGTVALTLTSTGNGSCSAAISQKVLTITPAPLVNAGPDQSACVPVSSVTLAGTVTNAGGGQWTTTGGGSFSPSGTTLNASYIPTTAESNTTSALTLTFTLVSTANGSCSPVTDQMVLTITPSPIVNAGADQTFCATNTNIALNGSVTGAPGASWTSSGSGTFTNANTLSTVYSPSSADRTAGTVTLTLTSAGGGCTAVSDATVLTIAPCLIDPQLAFESPTLFRNNGSDPFKLNFSALNSTGAITYAVRKLSTLGATSCATIDANGLVKPTCVDTVQVAAYQARKAPYEADTAYYTLYIGKASTQITLESRGGTVSGPDFSLLVTTNYDQPLTYAIVGGDVNAVSMTSAGVITPLAVGTVYIRATAAGDANYQGTSSNDAVVNIYPLLTKPVAINDTLKLEIGGEETLNIAKNDYGTTGSINLTPRMLIDIDAENVGVQNKYFKPGIGIFTVDSIGNLTFTAFEAFIGVDSIQYTITDENGLVSNKADVVIIVTSPIQEIALKANEIITANNDGKNESLVIGYTDLTRDNDLLVVDAAGNRLYYANNYQNNWYATDQSGNNLGSGVYYFIFREFTSQGTVRRQLKGNFTVIR